MKKLSHTDEKGKAKMVDVSQKPDQEREAVACGFIKLQAETIELIRQNQMKKGDVLTVYDMCKAVDKEMVIENIRLVSKTKK